ncbi:ScyD/ScyE family protein [Jiangella mangrovi]|uniref:Sugar lactone lactonase YvrE n=1 Tax=Jiangella mangrovi TaxID=1524084 RepID=A0A7W9GM38_9ACTN|nr:ScyD/ScyE family protein [Jiangella mangrovi]MBB5786051.1 sugar lactone lactonase YvrE [Jiangella mangrovi]
MVQLSRARTAAAVLATGVMAVSAVFTAPAAVAKGSSTPKPVASFDGPRGVDVDRDGRIVVGAADGTVSLVTDRGRHPKVREIGSVPATGLAPAVAAGRHDKFYALTGGGEPGTGAATLYLLRKGRDAKPIADIAAYQQRDPDPFNQEGEPTESNPFGVAALKDGSVLVADAAGNDLLRVYPNGHIVTVARLKPRTVEVPAGLPPEFDGNPIPPVGTEITAEAVATSVTVGPDGYWYVGELRGFPATPGTSEIWRIKPGTRNAVCNPERPHKGDCRRFADGLTSIVDLAPGSHGSILAVELVQQSWFQWELELVDPPIGGLFRVRPGGSIRELVPGTLILPGGADTAPNGKIYVTGPVFGPGSLSRIG